MFQHTGARHSDKHGGDKKSPIYVGPASTLQLRWSCSLHIQIFLVMDQLGFFWLFHLEGLLWSNFGHDSTVESWLCIESVNGTKFSGEGSIKADWFWHDETFWSLVSVEQLCSNSQTVASKGINMQQSMCVKSWLHWRWFQNVGFLQLQCGGFIYFASHERVFRSWALLGNFAIMLDLLWL